MADAFADCRRYRAGFPDEWRLHHQGGVTGYGSAVACYYPGHGGVLRETSLR